LLSLSPILLNDRKHSTTKPSSIPDFWKIMQLFQSGTLWGILCKVLHRLFKGGGVCASLAATLGDSFSPNFLDIWTVETEVVIMRKRTPYIFTSALVSEANLKRERFFSFTRCYSLRVISKKMNLLLGLGRGSRNMKEPTMFYSYRHAFGFVCTWAHAKCLSLLWITQVVFKGITDGRIRRGFDFVLIRISFTRMFVIQDDNT
jgi:hypothetical protein